MALDNLTNVTESDRVRLLGAGEIFDVDILDDSRWDELFAGSSSSLFSSSRWLGVLQSVYGFSFRARLCVIDGRAVAGFGYAELDGLRGERIVSLPFCDFNDPAVDSPECWKRLTDGLVGGQRPTVIRTLAHPVVSADGDLITTTVGVAHRLDASIEPEELRASFATLPKRMIKRAESDGLSTGVSTSRETLRSFFDLHLRVRKHRHGLLAQPYDLFEEIATQYFDQGLGYIAGSWADGSFVGGCVVLVDGDTAYYKFSASHPDHRRSGVSHVTLFEGLCEAHRRGLTWYDLGRSDLEPPGLADFKRRFRPSERAVTAHVWPGLIAPADVPDRTDLSDTLSALTTLFVRSDVPDDVTEQAGCLLYRYFA